MIRRLFKSKIRQGLLKLFFYNPGRRFYIRELAKIISASAGNTQKELRSLENEEIIKSEKLGNLRLYSINKSYPLLPELEKIIQKTIGIEYELAKKLKGLKGLKFALIYGSYAKGGLKADSDIDLLIVGNVKENEVIRRITKVERTILREINFHLIIPSEFSAKIKTSSFYKDVLKKYILVTNNENEFKRFIGKAGKAGEA